MNFIKKFFITAAVLFIMMPAAGNAQNLRKTVNDLNEVNESLKEFGETAEKLFGRFKKKDKSASETALASSGTQQGGGFRVVTHHPDFKIKVQRCEASGSICVIDMLLINSGSSDVNMNFLFGGEGRKETIAYDDEGNIIAGRNLLVQVSSTSLSYYYIQNTTLPAGIPIKCRVQLENFPISSKLITKLNLKYNCDNWGGYKDIQFYNIPVYREGDE